MPWVERVSGIIQAWYSGNSVGEALADVIFGKVNPSGRLALSFPAREQDNPAYMNTRSENGKIHYREDLFVGYKWYQARGIPPLFPFGWVVLLAFESILIHVSCFGQLRIIIYNFFFFQYLYHQAFFP